MSADYTQQQTPADQERSKNLSLKRTQPPTQVPGYEAQRLLGAGAYGEVWVGLNTTTGRQVAIKFYAHRKGVDWSLLAREVEKLVFLSADRYVVQLLDVGWNAEPPYFIMEYIENGSLDDFLRTHGPLSVPEAVELFEEIATGLSHAHGRGVLHCDLKPANILLDTDHKPRLADFGQSRLSSEQKPALGTLFYMAPEQADLEAVPDVRWDVYALGAILFCLVVGHPPHRHPDAVGQIETGQTLADRLARYRKLINTSPLPPAHRRVRGMDRALADLIDRCLAPDPRDRFDNVQEVLDALQARRRARARLPLMVLGFLLPMVLMFVMAIFGSRAYDRALEQTETLARQRALENNRFAAELAAERATGELADYFEVARDEAARSELREALAPVLTSQRLADLSMHSASDPQATAARQRFVDDSIRQTLNRWLETRMQTYRALADKDRRAPQFASIFLTDPRGTQIAAAHDEEVQSQSIGRNFAHRSYFHGGVDEMEPFDTVPTSPQHIERTFLSGVFKSSTTKQYKIAISTPLYREVDGVKLFDGVLTITLNLGDFEFSRLSSPSLDRFAVLVDGRAGEEEGTILQHPLFDQLLTTRKSLPEEFHTLRVPSEVCQGADAPAYFDPLGKHTLGKDFDRQWIAAAAKVRSPSSSAGGAPSGLVVLVQEDYGAVIEPVRQMGSGLLRLGLMATLVVVAVSGGLWGLVVYLFREKRTRIKRRSPMASMPTPQQELPTLVAGARPRNIGDEKTIDS
ncbi:serine/threonine protein kinase [Pirellula staleyi DSM 6068]|uniref:Serine/threonine protein kinase n=1 Tax=Pirellula staleyi (strain ATCC 27377 / DSM 6068 / ICPB 4128) TaxID=530564 RepID=D2R4D9_PIRSD|nr:serine/threonine protein kinase [Pirellula staleyi]ADB15287.1 serine/threonine protein kinase [Pirellula staleyi DSM 6068]